LTRQKAGLCVSRGRADVRCRVGPVDGADDAATAGCGQSRWRDGIGGGPPGEEVILDELVRPRAVVRTIVGYRRDDTTPELVLLNKIWVLQSLMTNFFYPQQKLVCKARLAER